MVAVDSSNLESVGHDPEENMLYIIFKAKRKTPRTMYRYTNVDESEYMDIVKGAVDGSAGKTFNQTIRNKKQYSGPLSPESYGL